MHTRWVCILGTQPLLTTSEVFALLKIHTIPFSLIALNHPVLVLETTEQRDISMAISESGGTIKLGKIVSTLGHISDLPDILTRLIMQDQKHDIGFSNYSKTLVDDAELLSTIKKTCSAEKWPLRYIQAHHDGVLSSVVVRKQEIVEYALLQVQNELVIAKMVFAQNSDQWNSRDYGRPFADPKRGMLPPKVARILVNIARSQTLTQEPVLLDPFCGMGTIAAEARMLGLSTIASDFEESAVKRAAANLTWLDKAYPPLGNPKREELVSDVTHIDEILPKESVDLVVTEPFMGIPFEWHEGKLTHKKKVVSKEEVLNMLKGLEKLYIGALRSIRVVLHQGGVVVMILPQIEFMRGKYTVKKVLDSLPRLGYTLFTGPLPYSRPQTVVKRQIYIFFRKD